ncbi:MAG: GNAT family N-acetyltransferase [Methylobacillus sp.]|jgi:GNAT superfamily N-acetyltransferase|nr:GNAT family N-acetyltransferase [Methylobacillus sp.]
MIRVISIDEAFDAPNFKELCDEYRAEVINNPDFNGIPPDRETYKRGVEAGRIVPLGAFLDGELVGFCALTISDLQHFTDRKIAVTETIFVAKAHRSSGIGLKLLQAAERMAAECGARGLYVSCPVGGALEALLPRLGYREMTKDFYRNVEEEQWAA